MLHVPPRRKFRRAFEPRGLFQIIVTSVLWGTGGVVVRLLHAEAHLDPLSIAFYRLAVAAPVLFALRPRNQRLRIDFRSMPVLLATTGIGLASYQALYFVAVTDIGVSVATAIALGLAPVLITVGGALRARRAPTLLVTLSVTVATSGLVLVSSDGLGLGARDAPLLLGLACAIGSGVAYACTTVLSRRATAAINPVSLTIITTAVGAVALAPAAAIGGLGFVVSVASVLELIYLGGVTTALAYVLFYRGLRTTPSGIASVLTLLEPLAAAALATGLLGSPLPASTALGGLLMICAVASLYIGGERTRDAPA